jgi:hypothetical protein
MARLSVNEDIEIIIFLTNLFWWFYPLRQLVGIEVWFWIWIWLSRNFVPIDRGILFEGLLWAII